MSKNEISDDEAAEIRRVTTISSTLFFIRTMFIRTSSLRFSKNQEHSKNIAEPQIIEKLRTSQPQKFKIRTNIGNYANLRKIHTELRKTFNF